MSDWLVLPKTLQKAGQLIFKIAKQELGTNPWEPPVIIEAAAIPTSRQMPSSEELHFCLGFEYFLGQGNLKRNGLLYVKPWQSHWENHGNKIRE